MSDDRAKATALASNLESFHQLFAGEIRDIDDNLVAYLDRFGSAGAHYGMLRYHLGYADKDLRRLSPNEYLPRGKRLRPIVCLLFCRLLKLPADIAGVVMMATEVMHSASLVHDDIQDKDAVRWGRPTVQSVFALEQAINVGDALTGIVYHLLLSLVEKGVEPSRVLELLTVFNRTHLQMCEGQHLDLIRRFDDDVSLADYLDMVSRKTASQCVCIADAIAILSGCPSATADLLRRFGQGLGMLYQICDDIRGIWCEPEVLGRLIGQDVSQHRASLPLLYGFKNGSPELRRTLRDRSQRSDPLSEHTVDYLRDELTACGARQQCLDVAAEYYRTAIQALDEIALEGVEVRQLRGILTTCFSSVNVAS